MVDLPILQPLVFRGLVEKMMAPDELVLLNRFPKRGTTEQTAAWDVLRGNRMVAKPNVPNSEAHIVPRPGYSSESASWIYLREKMGFEPSTTKMLRDAGQAPGARRAVNSAQLNAAILRDVAVLDNRFNNFAEICWWSAMSGRLQAAYADVNFTVDYKLPQSHTPTPSVGWDVATPQQILADIIAWRDLIRRDSQTTANEVYVTNNTMRFIFDAWTRVTEQGTTPFLTDRMRDAYWDNGTFGGFLGLQWKKVESSYQQESGTFADFVPDGALYMGNYTANNPMEMIIGPSFDFAAPADFVGKFAKNWEREDPSGRWFLLEWSIMPVIYRPEQMVFVQTVAPNRFPGRPA